MLITHITTARLRAKLIKWKYEDMYICTIIN